MRMQKHERIIAGMRRGLKANSIFWADSVIRDVIIYHPSKKYCMKSMSINLKKSEWSHSESAGGGRRIHDNAAPCIHVASVSWILPKFASRTSGAVKEGRLFSCAASLVRFLECFFRDVLLFISRIPRAETDIIEQHLAVFDIDFVGVQSQRKSRNFS